MNFISKKSTSSKPLHEATRFNSHIDTPESAHYTRKQIFLCFKNKCLFNKQGDENFPDSKHEKICERKKRKNTSLTIIKLESEIYHFYISLLLHVHYHKTILIYIMLPALHLII